MLCVLRLYPYFRSVVYALFSILFITGAAWIAADQMKDAPLAGETWQMVASNLLMIHGGAAMLTLICIGSLIPLHMERGWRSRRNRLAGAVMVGCNTVLIATAFGLYYAGSEIWRPWMSNLHIALGIVLPALFIMHVLAGRRSSSRPRNVSRQ